VEDLVSRGHPFQEVVHGYPVGLVLNLHKAIQANRRQQAVELAVGVSLGIRDAFNKEGSLVKLWLQDQPDSPQPAAAKAAPASPVEQFFGRLPVVVKERV
jgi:hypothetical protein